MADENKKIAEENLEKGRADQAAGSGIEKRKTAETAYNENLAQKLSPDRKRIDNVHSPTAAPPEVDGAPNSNAQRNAEEMAGQTQASNRDNTGGLSDQQKLPREKANREPSWADRLRRKKPATGEKNPASPAEKNAVDGATDAVKKGKNLIDSAQLAARAFAGDVTAAIKLLWKDPKTRWIIIAAVAVSLISLIILIAVPIALLGGLGGSPNSTVGKSQPRQVDVTKPADKKTVQQVAALMGVQSASSALLDQATNTILQNSLTVKNARTQSDTAAKIDPTGDTVISQIDTLDASITALQANKSAANAKTFISRLTDLDNMVENSFVVYPGTSTRAPVSTTNLTFNTNLVGGSFQHPAHIDNDGVYTAYDQGACDAVDLSANTNDPVYPIFGGTVAAVNDDGAAGKYVVVKDGDYQILYAHLTNVNYKVGDSVTINNQIGNVKLDHIQIEAIYKNQCLVTTYGDLLDHALKTPKHDNIGGYLWDHFVTAFHITS